MARRRWFFAALVRYSDGKDQPGNMRFAHAPKSTPRGYTIGVGLLIGVWGKLLHLQGEMSSVGS
jgi:hypothetical protein